MVLAAKKSTHADAVNIARRLSSRAENDLLQENLYDDDVSLSYCQGLAAKLVHVKDLPDSCKKYPDVVKTLQRRTTGSASDAAIAFQGMRPGSAAKARSARSRGQEHDAQIQRRYTKTNL